MKQAINHHEATENTSQTISLQTSELSCAHVIDYTGDANSPTSCPTKEEISMKFTPYAFKRCSCLVCSMIRTASSFWCLVKGSCTPRSEVRSLSTNDSQGVLVAKLGVIVEGLVADVGELGVLLVTADGLVVTGGLDLGLVLLVLPMLFAELLFLVILVLASLAAGVDAVI